jgi:hypothetical protein
MEPIMNQLDEIVIRRYDNVSTVSSSANKSVHSCGKKIKTATGLNASASAGGMAGGSISADPLINF